VSGVLRRDILCQGGLGYPSWMENKLTRSAPDARRAEIFCESKKRPRFPMGNRYPVLHLTEDFHVRTVFVDGRSRKLSWRFEGRRAERAGRRKQVFPADRRARHKAPKNGQPERESPLQVS
jgi:hypothetical protein